MYILGLSPSWGTSRICPAWSPSEHQLTPALSPFWGPRLKPRHPEEVVYGLNDSCSHFTQRLFPPKLPQQHTCTTFITHSSSFILIIHHICTSSYIILLHDKLISSLLWFFVAGRLPSVSCVRYTYKCLYIAIYNTMMIRTNRHASIGLTSKRSLNALILCVHENFCAWLSSYCISVIFVQSLIVLILCVLVICSVQDIFRVTLMSMISVLHDCFTLCFCNSCRVHDCL